MSLEPRSVTHAQELFALLSDPLIYEFLDESAPESFEQLRQRLARSEGRKSPDGTEHWLNWVVRDAQQCLIGQVQATISANLDTNVAYVFGSAHWGRGLAYPAVEQMLRLVRAEFGVTRFYIVAERANQRSLRLARRLGFTEPSDTLALLKNLSPTEVLLQHGMA